MFGVPELSGLCQTRQEGLSPYLGGSVRGTRTIFCFLSGEQDGQLWAMTDKASGHMRKNQCLNLLPFVGDLNLAQGERLLTWPQGWQRLHLS